MPMGPVGRAEGLDGRLAVHPGCRKPEPAACLVHTQGAPTCSVSLCQPGVSVAVLMLSWPLHAPLPLRSTMPGWSWWKFASIRAWCRARGTDCRLPRSMRTQGRHRPPRGSLGGPHSWVAE